MASSMTCVIAPTFTDPWGYQLSQLPIPSITEPKDVVIRVYAASVNPIDVKKAAGALKLAVKDEFPYKIGYDCSGVVTATGSAVTQIHVGDEVYARLPEVSRGAWSEYAKCAEFYVARKPKSLSFGDAASLPLAAVTALQALRRYKGSLEGKTVFIPAGLSGTGAYACQLAKNVFHASKVITTVSTAKILKVPELLGKGIVDQVIDYTKNDPMKVIPPGSIDFLLDTTGESMRFLSLMTPSTSFIASIATMPSGDVLQNSPLMRRPDKPQLPWLARISLNIADFIRRARARRWRVEYEYFFLEPNGEDLETLSSHVEQGKVVPVVGSRVPMQDIEQIREACGLVYKGKGGIGKTVIEMV
ncbi:uncharacterized protein PV06_10816 [Exophiala oligosperma]|uniref:Enoyl reductase (ER) domain-containing protein n=1 Tax=Exophiala oligosperma TaxID=215243 RepID=A0A0D2BHJ7_9EURO|nr:uncharacterized protein PV06_10816 [Exophiala oligosperma]KIW36912.1 hypothetical protein PV06_10816 [Exophiala oligosperma]